uniref:Uncharacterized protein n=1 Tax=Arundo donax TaxID=35708 RepID=A0A0A9HYM8_ARUDO
MVSLHSNFDITARYSFFFWVKSVLQEQTKLCLYIIIFVCCCATVRLRKYNFMFSIC